MGAEVFAEWLRRQGYHVVRTASSYWYDAGWRVYQAFPYHWLIEPSDDELAEMLRAHHAIALRYSTPLGAPHGKLSYHVVCQGPYALASLTRQARQGVKKGLDYVSVEPVSMRRMADEGWKLRRETLERQGRTRAETEEWWRTLCLSAEGLPGFEAWGAIHEGEMVASFLAFVCDDCYLLPHEQSATDHLPFRVNNALFFAVTQQALARSNIRRVFFCLQSLDAPCSVDEFKFRMGYSAVAVRQRVVFHPQLAPVAQTHVGYAAVRRLAEHYPGQVTWTKAEGMLRFFQEGNLALTQQHAPEVLIDFQATAQAAD